MECVNVKRLFDFVMAGLGMLLFSPIMVVVAIAILLKMGRPIVFTQLRPGLHGNPFLIYKFRTMTDDRGPDGKWLPDAERTTALGVFLRRFSLDELPQLLNVWKGDMSLVGPRPLEMEYLPIYSNRQAKRHDVRPGITGWAQINGRNSLSWEQKLELDVWYVENRSFWLDMKILWQTVLIVFDSKGINEDASVAAPDFQRTTESDLRRIQEK